jgi:hypothetical protein
MPTRACHPSAWLKVEAVCKHFLFVASGKQPRQAVGTVKKTKPFVWQWRKATMCIFFIGLLLCATATVENIFWFLFFSLSRLPVTLVAASDVHF